MSNGIKVRTPEAHKIHVRMTTFPGVGGCGCATKENVADKGDLIVRCICGCAYLMKFVEYNTPVTCYDCKRALKLT